MIAANELRIGNWILDGYANYGKVDYVKKYEILINNIGWQDGGSYDIRLLKPIPLTEEILLKIKGISVSKTNRNRFCLNGYEIYIFRNKDESIDKIIFAPTDVIYSVKLNSLHQLQNLYFALTNTELNINI